MNKLRSIVNVSKALGLTVTALGVNAIDKVKSGVEISREVYATAKERVLQREHDRMTKEHDKVDDNTDIRVEYLKQQASERAEAR